MSIRISPLLPPGFTKVQFDTDEERERVIRTQLGHLDLPCGRNVQSDSPSLGSTSSFSDSEEADRWAGSIWNDYVGREAGDTVIEFFRGEECRSLPAAESSHYKARRNMKETALTRSGKVLTKHTVVEARQTTNNNQYLVDMIVPIDDDDSLDADEDKKSQTSGYMSDNDADSYVNHLLKTSQIATEKGPGFGNCETLAGGRRGVLIVNEQSSLYVSDTIVIGNDNNIMGDRNLIVGDGNAGYGNYLRSRGARNHLTGLHCTNLDTGKEGTVTGAYSNRIKTLASNVRLTLGGPQDSGRTSILVSLSISARAPLPQPTSPPPVLASTTSQSSLSSDFQSADTSSGSMKSHSQGSLRKVSGSGQCNVSTMRRQRVKRKVKK